MKYVATLLIVALLSSCEDSRWNHEFELDEGEFDLEVMQMIRDDSELTLPERTEGLNFRYKPPIDPSFIARLAVPEESVKELHRQIDAIKNEKINITGGLRERTTWWTPTKGEVIVDRECNQSDGDYFKVTSDKRRWSSDSVY